MYLRDKRILGLSAIAGITLLLFSWSEAPAAGEQKSSLYERLGGVYAIATVVDVFIDRLLVNDTLNANPAIDAARASVPKAGLKYQVTSLVTQATGGPEVYTGRSMKEAHAHLNITEKEWAAMIADFKATLAEFDVPTPEQQELLAILEGKKGAIVVATD